MLIRMGASMLALSALMLAKTAYAQMLAVTHDAKYDWDGMLWC